MTDLTAARALEIVRATTWKVMTAADVQSGMMVERDQIARCRILWSMTLDFDLFWDLDMDEVYFFVDGDQVASLFWNPAPKILHY